MDVVNDAAYIDLALREGLPPVTLDARMRTAAQKRACPYFRIDPALRGI